jgi:hypothetical protein
MNSLATGIVAGVAVLAAPFVLPSLAYAAGASEARLAWPAVYADEPVAVAVAAPYRTNAAPRLVARRVRRAGGPVAVRGAAFASFLLGQMFLPGLALGLFGFLYYGIGLVSLPGLYVAYKNVALGFALLRRKPGIVEEARAAAALTYMLNAVVLAIGLVGAFFAPAFGLLVPYALLSIAHGALLQRAAAAALAADRAGE